LHFAKVTIAILLQKNQPEMENYKSNARGPSHIKTSPYDMEELVFNIYLAMVEF